MVFTAHKPNLHFKIAALFNAIPFDGGSLKLGGPRGDVLGVESVSITDVKRGQPPWEEAKSSSEEKRVPYICSAAALSACLKQLGLLEHPSLPRAPRPFGMFSCEAIAFLKLSLHGLVLVSCRTLFSVSRVCIEPLLASGPGIGELFLERAGKERLDFMSMLRFNLQNQAQCT